MTHPDTPTKPLGATCTSEGVAFRVWAPAARKVEIAIAHPKRRRFALQSAGGGYFHGVESDMRAGDCYGYLLDDHGPYPDPCSRFQPLGPHGSSMVVDPNAYAWGDAAWRGVAMHGQVIYELHIGTFTQAGTFAAALDKLPYLQSLGVTVLELMPVAEFPGRWNWGYDGVNLFAPFHGYGDCESFKRFVDRAHQLGLAVVLDVVYNHLGPDGNYLSAFSPNYLTERHSTDWGPTFNYDGEESAGVREFILENACYWIREYHLDGLRLDATQDIHDSSKPHILAELSERTRAAAGARKIILMAENEPQHASQLRSPADGGFGLDALWNDDFHHSAQVALIGRRGAYYHDYAGRPQEFVSALKRGFLFQGQYYHWQKKRRGQPLKAPASSCVVYLQNHDQVANSVSAARVCTQTSPARYRALVAVLLLGPQTPLLFMGQEFNATTPFCFFAEHVEGLKEKVSAGRRGFVAQFPGADTPAAQRLIPDPAAESAFHRCKLPWQELLEHAGALQLHSDLLALRKKDPVISQQCAERLDGAVLSEQAFVVRWFDERAGDRLLLVNFGIETRLDPAAEPLLAPPWGAERWQLLWSSEDTVYGGAGIVQPESETGWNLPAESAVLFKAP